MTAPQLVRRRWPAAPARAELGGPADREWVRRAAAGLGVAGLVVVVAVMTSHQPRLAVAVGAVVIILGLLLRHPAAIPLLAVPATVAINRVGGEPVDLSVSDLALFVAFWPAVLLGPRPFSRPLRSMLWASGVYQALTLFTVIANPYLANTVEWFHAWLLVSGALVVGWAVGAAGLARAGLVLLVAAAAVVSVATTVQWLQNAAEGYFGPVYLNEPLMMHKNFIGCVLAAAALVVYARPSWLRWKSPLSMVLFVLFLAGILAAQSRQAIVGLAAAISLVALRHDPERKRSKIVLLGVAAIAVAVLTLVREQLESDNRFNSAYQRLSWFADSLQVWEEYPLFGAGLRWWYTGRFQQSFQPPNAELEVLSSTGIVGLTGFLVFVIAAVVILAGMDPRYGTLALAALLMRLVQGQFDIFWVAGQASIPFVIIGICIGAQAHAERRGPPEGTGASPVERRPRYRERVL